MLNKAINLMPNSYNSCLQLALCFKSKDYKHKSQEKAIELFEKTIKINPKFEKGYM